MKFGEKLKELRNEKEWTQPDMGEAIGIEQSYWSKLENDKSLPSNDIFIRILEVFGLDIADLVDDLDQSKLFVFVGVLMTMFGLVGLFLEKIVPLSLKT